MQEFKTSAGAVRALMGARRETVEQFAAAAGIEAATIEAILSGEVEPTYEQGMALQRLRQPTQAHDDLDVLLRGRSVQTGAPGSKSKAVPMVYTPATREAHHFAEILDGIENPDQRLEIFRELLNRLQELRKALGVPQKK